MRVFPAPELRRQRQIDNDDDKKGDRVTLREIPTCRFTTVKATVSDSSPQVM